MHIPEIIEVKEQLDLLKSEGKVTDWELPYENLLTRRSAAIFFFNPVDTSVATIDSIKEVLNQFEHFSYRDNKEQKLSTMKYRLTFSEEEKTKNETLEESVA